MKCCRLTISKKYFCINTPLSHEQNKCGLDAENKPSTLAAGTLHGIRCVCKRKLVFLKSAKPLLVLVRVFSLNEWWPTSRVPILSTCTCSCVLTMLSSRLCVAVFRLAFTNLKFYTYGDVKANGNNTHRSQCIISSCQARRI